jgi:hypothetical protein
MPRTIGEDEAVAMDAVTAFEGLRHDLGEVEAFAVAADEVLVALPSAADAGQGRQLERACSLVTATARHAVAAMDRADAVLAELDRRCARLRALGRATRC